MAKVYEYPSEETIEAIKQLIGEFSLHVGNRDFDRGFYLTINRDYDYFKFDGMSTLQGYMKLAELLGCVDGDEVDRSYTRGNCSTCDYGTDYEVELRFW